MDGISFSIGSRDNCDVGCGCSPWPMNENPDVRVLSVAAFVLNKVADEQLCSPESAKQYRQYASRLTELSLELPSLCDEHREMREVLRKAYRAPTHESVVNIVEQAAKLYVGV